MTNNFASDIVGLYDLREMFPTPVKRLILEYSGMVRIGKTFASYILYV